MTTSGETSRSSRSLPSSRPGEERSLNAIRPDLTISVISTDNMGLLLPCLRSLFAATHRCLPEVFLVDNASTDGTSEAVKAEFPQVRIIRNSIPTGFSSNNNLVLRMGSGRFLMLLNDDTVVMDGSLDALVDFLDKHPVAGAAGSLLLNPDLTPQPSFSSFPHPVMEAIWPAAHGFPWPSPQRSEPFPVDCVSGAAMVVRREVLHQIGPLDPRFDPVYSEEVDWCFRIKQGGWQVFAVPASKVVHFGSVTMNRTVARKYELLLSHKAMFFRKHMGASAVHAYRATLWITTAAKVIWWSFLGLFRKRHKERSRLHRHVLKRIPWF